MKKKPNFPLALGARSSCPQAFGTVLKAQLELTQCISDTILCTLGKRWYYAEEGETVTDFLLEAFEAAKAAEPNSVIWGLTTAIEDLKTIKSNSSKVDINAYEAKIAQIMNLNFTYNQWGSGVCAYDPRKSFRMLRGSDGALLFYATKEATIEMLRQVSFEVFGKIARERTEDELTQKFLKDRYPLFRRLSQLIDMLHVVIDESMPGDDDDPLFKFVVEEGKSFIWAYNSSYAAFLACRELQRPLPREVEFEGLFEKRNLKALEAYGYGNLEAILHREDCSYNIVRDAEMLCDVFEAVRTQILQQLSVFGMQVADYLIKYPQATTACKS